MVQIGGNHALPNGMAMSPAPQGVGGPGGLPVQQPALPGGAPAMAPGAHGAGHQVHGGQPADAVHMGGVQEVAPAATMEQMTNAIHQLHAQTFHHQVYLQNLAAMNAQAAQANAPPGSMPGSSNGPGNYGAAGNGGQWPGYVEMNPGGYAAHHGHEGGVGVPVGESDDDLVEITAGELQRLRISAAKGDKKPKEDKSLASFPPRPSSTGNRYYVVSNDVVVWDDPGVVCGWQLLERNFVKGMTWSLGRDRSRGFPTLDEAIAHFFAINPRKWTVRVRKA